MRSLHAALVALLLCSLPVVAQGRGTTRIGVSLGGISSIGLIVEHLDGHDSFELNIGTLSFRDLSVSLVRRHYLGVADVRPTVGVGLWGVIAFPPDERTSAALVLRAPIGVEARFGNHHALTLDISVNRGLRIRRSDPDDDTPMNKRLIPLPGLAYRWQTNR